jgi:pyruvate/2-oxoglutarate dehydrogenase complex dihydrolipoamide acyltransferase (E2) component
MSSNEGINNSWRKVSVSMYKKPSDSKIFGSVEIDVTDLEHYISQKRKEGLKITLTHIFTLAVARAIKQDIPELNGYVCRGNIVSRDHIDAVVSVLIQDSEMSSVKIHDADILTLVELSALMSEEIKNSRQGSENSTMKLKKTVSRIPWPLRTWIIRAIKKITIDWGIPLPFLNLTPNSFGSYMVSNIGTIGLDMGYPALFPISNVPLVLIMGGISKKPYVVNDQILIRRVISLGAALDHRVIDAMHGGKLFRYIKYIVNNPTVLETKPDWFMQKD